LLKAIAILSYGVSIFLIGAILAELRPQWKMTGMLAFAWNPLVLLETAQNGHNDMLMATLMLASLWALVKGKHAWVMPLLAMSVLVKFMTVLVAPLFALYLSSMQYAVCSKRERRKAKGERMKAKGNFTRSPAHRPTCSSTPPLPHPLTPLLLRALAHLLIFALLVILPMLPLWPGLENWAVLRANSGAGRSALALMVLMLRDFSGTSAAFSMSRLTLHGLWAGIILFLIWKIWRELRTTKDDHYPLTNALIFLSWTVLFWYVLLAAPVFHGWYLLWFIPLAILLPPSDRKAERRVKYAIRPFAHSPFAATLVFSFTALLVIPYFETLRVWFPILLENHLLGHLIGVTLLLLPPTIIFWRNTT
ncbi:MAG TPA: hypothetical protein G4N96_13275, partial [Chloroflexi bacterium]|nr:hypothetical protein [Chloroflexota bacterium]